jgi:hypothetical protein
MCHLGSCTLPEAGAEAGEGMPRGAEVVTYQGEGVATGEGMGVAAADITILTGTRAQQVCCALSCGFGLNVERCLGPIKTIVQTFKKQKNKHIVRESIRSKFE